MYNKLFMMQELRSTLSHRYKRITVGAGLKDLTFGPITDCSFTVTAAWGEHRWQKTYTPGNSLIRQPGRYRLKQTPCRFADEIIAGVLKAKGGPKKC